MNTRLNNLLALLGALAAAVLPAWIDPQQTLVARVAITIVTAALLWVKTDKLATYRNAIFSGLAVAGIIVAGIVGKYSAGSAGFAISGFLLALITQLRVIFAKKFPVVPTALVLFGLLTLGGPGARADINLDNIAPQLTKCWGTTCLMPDAAVNAALFAISSKKWEVGTTSLGAGMALLFVADIPYASGLTVHMTGVLTQTAGQSSFVMPTAGLVLMRYFEVGYSYRLSSSAPNTSYISVAGNIPWDVFTAATLPQRATEERARMGAVQ